MSDEEELKKAISLVMGQKPEIFSDLKIFQKELSTINNLYYRINILLEVSSGRSSSVNSQIPVVMMQFHQLEQYLRGLPTERERTSIIKRYPDDFAKIALLRQIKKSQNRQEIIDSLSCEIDPKIRPYVNLVQNMIKEYFQDIAGKNFDTKKRERLNMTLNMFNVKYKSSLPNGLNGVTDSAQKVIIINSKVGKNINELINDLLHEYGHALSAFYDAYTGYAHDKIIDEGMQDLFSDIVMNHYIKKHTYIKIEGRKVRINTTNNDIYSAYNEENAIIRSILYPLSREKNKAETVMMEYILGDKNKFWEMILGRECEKDISGNPDVKLATKDIYRLNPESYKKIDDSSIFSKRNPLIYLFELQNKLEKYGIDFFSMKANEPFSSIEIGNMYFENKKLYEIPKEEMKRFCKLYNVLKKVYITDIIEFRNFKLKELTDEEINQYSFEILEGSLPLWDFNVLGTINTDLLSKTIEIEDEKAREGQSLQTSIEKYKKIIPEAIEVLDNRMQKTYESNRNVLDLIKNLQFTYITQIEDALEQGKKDEVLECLINKKTGEIFLDNEIQEVLEHFGFNLKYNLEYTVGDIFKSAKRGNLKLDEVSKAKFMIEQENIAKETINEKNQDNR